ncbi:hypothetical protein H5410_030652, partial [Solanum commersonii]
MNFDSDGIEEYNELVAALDKHEYGPNQKYELDMKNREYVYLGEKNTLRSSLQFEFKARRVFGGCIKRGSSELLGGLLQDIIGIPT